MGGIILWVFYLHSTTFKWKYYFNALGTEDSIRSVSLGYLTAVSYGAIPIALYQALRNYSEGITQTKIVFMIGGLGFILNIH